MFKTKLNIRYIGVFNNKKMYRIKTPLIYKSTVVPVGFLTDVASIPEKLQWLYAQTGRYSRSCVLHDYLYASKCPKDISDNIFYEAMKSDGVGLITRKLFYYAVKYFGDNAYDKC